MLIRPGQNGLSSKQAVRKETTENTTANAADETGSPACIEVCPVQTNETATSTATASTACPSRPGEWLAAQGAPLDDRALASLQALAVRSSKNRKRVGGLRPRDSFFSRQDANRKAAKEMQARSDESDEDVKAAVQGLATILEEGQRSDNDRLGHAGRSLATAQEIVSFRRNMNQQRRRTAGLTLRRSHPLMQRGAMQPEREESPVDVKPEIKGEPFVFEVGQPAGPVITAEMLDNRVRPQRRRTTAGLRMRRSYVLRQAAARDAMAALAAEDNVAEEPMIKQEIRDEIKEEVWNEPMLGDRSELIPKDEEETEYDGPVASGSRKRTQGKASGSAKKRRV